MDFTCPVSFSSYSNTLKEMLACPHFYRQRKLRDSNHPEFPGPVMAELRLKPSLFAEPGLVTTSLCCLLNFHGPTRCK